MGTGAVEHAVPTRRPKRVFSLDLIRAIATLLIVLTHFNNPFYTDGGYLLMNQPFGVYVGAWGVSLFLIVSGASLALTYHWPISLRTFYWKRFRGIYPMFWVAWVLGTMFFFLVGKGVPMNAAPARSIIWTVLGIDGLVANFHVTTAYLLGEWFLGFIILFYVIFPLLMLAVEQRPVLTAVVLLVLYAGTLILLRGSSSVPTAMLLPVRLPELAFGMYFVRYRWRVRVPVIVVSLAVLIACSLLPTAVPEDVGTTLVGIASFLILVYIAPLVQIRPVLSLVRWVSRYSYAVFLVHHVVIFQLFFYSGLPWSSFYPVQKVALLGVVIVVTFALAVALDRLTAWLVAAFRAAFSGPWWRREVAL